MGKTAAGGTGYSGGRLAVVVALLLDKLALVDAWKLWALDDDDDVDEEEAMIMGCPPARNTLGTNSGAMGFSP